MRQALRAVAPGFRAALQTAARNIRQFCEWQMPRRFKREIQAGVSVGQEIRPLDSVGCYVPGGRYPLPSSLLMTVIPAQVARVPRIAVVSPRPAQETLAAAALLGVEHFFRVGGAQAIAALAYGTESVPRVSKIVGPGNSFVTAAKKLVAFDCAIDMLAGPTEVVIVSEDGKGGVYRRRPGGAGGTRCRGPGGLHHVIGEAGARGRRRDAAPGARQSDGRGIAAAKRADPAGGVARKKRWRSPTPSLPSTSRCHAGM